MARLRDLAKKPSPLTSGHRACSGCAFPQIARQVLLAADTPVVVVVATGCMEVATTIFPYTAWNVPWLHCAFENAASTLSGIEAAYRALKKRGVIDREIRFVAFGGDGGTYDIGLQALSGALERGHRLLYVCYDNQAYMNTGIQRSGATPQYAHTTTSPAGNVIPGKLQWRKDLTEIVVAHDIPYVAQSTPAHWNDLITKAQKALAVDGPSFINVLQPCRLGWTFEGDMAIELARLAADTCIWPLYEVVNGEYRLTYRPKEKKPVEEWLKLQRRFRHLFTEKNRHLIEEIQAEIDRRWERLLKKCGLA